MKKIFFLTILIFILGSCKQAAINELSVDQPTFEVPFDQPSLVIKVHSSAPWGAMSDAEWCKVDYDSGSASQEITVTLSPNITTQARQTKITITSGNGERQATVEIKQGASDGKEYHYKIPVIFHILYQNKSDENQYVKQGWMAHVLAICNEIYANKAESHDTGKKGVDMNLEFVMATTTPSGKVLEEPGVERKQISTEEMSCLDFMNTKDAVNAAMLWDLNRYINVFVYQFAEPGILGVAHIPYTLKSYHLEGLSDGEYYLENSKPNYPHCVSINNSAIYVIPKPGYIATNTITETLAHELGHYVGLFHAFGNDHQDDKGNVISWKDDTDYCNDTPNYDRAGYEDWLDNYMNTTPPEKLKFPEMNIRTAIDGKKFVSRNIMDYYWTWSNEFTPDQRIRVRHVLNYSPLMPGPKLSRSLSRADGPWTEPPIRAIQ
ncbi:MAG: zinc-dependent metalloproteinase lipoprotein [Mucinivorans sp.]